MKARINKIPVELASCGVFCGACPSFGKSCQGCPSEDVKQKRKSKWSCEIRNCCYFTHNINFCFECSEFPCKKLGKKLFNSHSDDPKYQYRHEIIKNLEMLSELGVKDYLKYQEKKWECPSCKGRVYWYHYRCSQCNQESLSKS